MPQDALRDIVSQAVAAGNSLLEHVYASPVWAAIQQSKRFFVLDPNNYTHLALLGIAGFFVIRIVLAVATNNGPARFSMDKVRRQAVATKRTFTPRELAEFAGQDENTPVYLAIRGVVYDVSKSRHFYGPEGPYSNFAGRDASRGLAMSTFDDSVLTDLDAPIDPLDNLEKSEQASLDEWTEFFAGKYTPIGTLMAPPVESKKEQ
ncbi:Dihydrodipicolinate synthase [Coemansia sp. RSA 2711]|nr:Dihydrodipicolinate synthase [Coemansia sp. RSA 2711]KAJ2324867.1 Dihydrodipicolinate synthase [Coemansia sp. RSA 2702]KAJ2366785.1 Dihydrodipicolinate synthase [Coemansia sp. RSA 2610]KAJ2388056.1 Dihydrodipicolinate synthase [Coemansia sp. RSA 2611]KAJ2738353.1 Dihydrodipicolinate synthase [Coemansia sp. Cherry 401B]